VTQQGFHVCHTNADWVRQPGHVFNETQILGHLTRLTNGLTHIGHIAAEVGQSAENVRALMQYQEAMMDVLHDTVLSGAAW